jgi:hypothetical protein
MAARYGTPRRVRHSILRGVMRVGVNLLNFGPGVSPEALAGWTQLA